MINEQIRSLKDAGDVRLRKAENAEAEAKFAAERRSSELTLQNEKRITELQNEGGLATVDKNTELDLGQRTRRKVSVFRQNIAKEQTTLTSEQDLIEIR